MSDITLTSGVRNNLLAMQNTADLLGRTQNRLATGKKVNSALDNPTNFFTSSSLNARAGDLSRLLDSISNGIRTLQAADKGLEGITKLVEFAQATARQARQAAGPAAVAATVEGTGAALEADVAQVSVSDGTFDTDGGAGTFTINEVEVAFEAEDDIDTVTQAINTAMADAGINITASNDGDNITLTAGDAATSIELGGDDLDAVGLDFIDDDASTAQVNLLTQGFAQDETLTVQVGNNDALTITFGTGEGEVSSLAQLQAALGELAGGTATVDEDGNVSVTATNSADSIVIGGDADASLVGLEAGTTEPTSTNNATRENLESDYNLLLTQITQLAADSGYNGINLLNGDNLEVIFNEDGSSSLSIDGVDFSSSGLGLTPVAEGDFQSNTDIDTVLGQLDTAIADLRAQASRFGSNLSVVETRQNFTKNMVNVLETGAANLVLADVNEEGANMLALQTRQQLSSVSLSMAAQADQNVLRLF